MARRRHHHPRSRCKGLGDHLLRRLCAVTSRVMGYSPTSPTASPTRVPTATIPWPFAGTTPTGSSPEGGWRITFASRSAIGTRSRGTVSTSSVRHDGSTVASDVCGGRRPDGRGEAEDGRRLRILRQARRAVLLLPRPRHRTGGGQLQRVGGQSRRDGRRRRAASAANRCATAVGHRQPVLQPALSGRRGDQSRPRGVRVSLPRPGREKITTLVTGGRVKLQWKPDWAMRWLALGVDYEDDRQRI